MFSCLAIVFLGLTFYQISLQKWNKCTNIWQKFSFILVFGILFKHIFVRPLFLTKFSDSWMWLWQLERVAVSMRSLSSKNLPFPPKICGHLVWMLRKNGPKIDWLTSRDSLLTSRLWTFLLEICCNDFVILQQIKHVIFQPIIRFEWPDFVLNECRLLH